jgi:hypothetical protein
VSPRIPSSSRSGDPHYLLSDGYPVWRLPDIKLRHWRPPWGHHHDDRVNSKDLTSKNQSTATAPISNSPTLRIPSSRRNQVRIIYSARCNSAPSAASSLKSIHTRIRRPELVQVLDHRFPYAKANLLHQVKIRSGKTTPSGLVILVV